MVVLVGVMVVVIVVVAGRDPRDDLDATVLHAAHRQDAVGQVLQQV